MFTRWRRTYRQRRQRARWLYGWFTGLVCCGSCFGAAAFASGLQFLVLKCKLHIPTSPQCCAIPVACWRHASAAFAVAHVIEFLCFSFTKLMVLNRMIERAVIHETATSRWSHIVIRWFKFGFASSAASSCIANTDLANNFSNVSDLQSLLLRLTLKPLKCFPRLMSCFRAFLPLPGLACCVIEFRALLCAKCLNGLVLQVGIQHGNVNCVWSGFDFKLVMRASTHTPATQRQHGSRFV